MIPFYRPYFDHSELLAALRPGSGRAEFESAVAGSVGARHGIAFAYGRSGMIATLKALEIQQAEVILPAYTCEVMAQAVVASGNRPVFVDIDLADYNMDLGQIKQALSSQTRAIIATYMYGYPADVDAMRSIAGDERIIIIEDRAQGMPSSFAGTAKLRGDIGVCSFGPNKQLSTVQGGVIVTNSSAHYEKIKAYRDSHMDMRAVSFHSKPWMRLLASYLVFRRPAYGLLQRIGLMGWNDRLDKSSDSSQATLPRNYGAAYLDFQARIGLAQLSKLETIVSKRRALAQVYDGELREVVGLRSAPIVAGATYAYYTLRVRRRDEINFPLRMLAQSVAVDQTYDYVVPLLEAYRMDAGGEYPYARQAAQEVVNLPIYPDLSPGDARYIAASVRRAIQEDFKT